MKFSHLLALTGFMAPTMAQFATQTFFVPMPEPLLFEKTFKKINSRANGNVETMISATVSIDGTIVYFDHWEDGYEPDASNPTQSSTEIWGDGNHLNGCAPGVDPCTDGADVLVAGTAIIMESSIVLPRDLSIIEYDGGDRLQATKPVAMTRGAYPYEPGGLMAGAIEILDTFDWGTKYESPVGVDADLAGTRSFQYTALYIQAGHDDTVITIKRGSSTLTTQTLARGETYVHYDSNQGDTVESDTPFQVDLITGDKGSSYELRWFALLPTDQWSNSYVSPVGESKGQTRLVFYNPGSSWLDITYEWLGGSDLESVPPGGSVQTWNYIPTGSGAFINASAPFLCLSLTDTINSGQNWDWGFPVMPREKLSSQVLIGLGFGCAENSCGDKSEKTVVWLTPTKDAVIHVDYDNDGVVDDTFEAARLSSTTIMDADKDMSGAIIFAKDKFTEHPIDIAAAWGQDPSISAPGDRAAMDLGTVILPYKSLRTTRHVDLIDDADGDGSCSVGDKVLITIKVMNVGQADLAAGSWTVQEDFSSMTYVPHSCTYHNVDTDETFSVIDVNGEPDLSSRAVLKRRGGEHNISFEAILEPGSPIECLIDITETQDTEPDIDVDPYSGDYPVPDPVFKPGCPVPEKPRKVIYISTD